MSSPALGQWSLSHIFLMRNLTAVLLSQEQDDMLENVKRQRLSEQTLLQKLTDYVERIDTDLVSMFQNIGQK